MTRCVSLKGLQKAYEELRRTQQVVVQQERLRALGQMASGVAHDINNALSPVLAYSELLLSTLPDLPEVFPVHITCKTINQAGGRHCTDRRPHAGILSPLAPIWS